MPGAPELPSWRWLTEVEVLDECVIIRLVRAPGVSFPVPPSEPANDNFPIADPEQAEALGRALIAAAHEVYTARAARRADEHDKRRRVNA